LLKIIRNILCVGLLGLLVSCAEDKESNNIDTSNQVEQYIVVFKSSSSGIKSQSLNRVLEVESQLKSLSDAANVVELKSFSGVIQGGVYRLNPNQLKNIKLHPSVAYVEPDHIVTINAVQSNATWGLDRIDQPSSVLDKKYKYETTASNVHAYVIDTGILTTHQDFGGRAVHGYDAVDDDIDATDCNGHGTHVAGTIGGSLYGVAKEVKLVAVRVLNCSGSGRYSDVIEGIEWVTDNHVKPAVANMSLGGPVSQALEDAMRASIQAGVSYVVAAGNENANACNSSPSRLAEALTVGSIAKDDKRSDFSNWGTCLDVFAPGSDITSAWHTSPTATDTIDGTSMAAPHVAGVAALVLSVSPLLTPAEVSAAIVNNALVGKVSDARTGSPNKLLNSAFVVASEPPVDPEPPVDDGALKIGSRVSGLAGEKGKETAFKLNVPASLSQIEVLMSGGSGDADLYVKINGEVSLTKYDCRPYKWGNVESCVFANPVAGVYQILVRGYAAFGDVSLEVK
jgi:serine protease